MLDAFLDWLAGLPAALQYGVLMLLSALENVFPPIPADVAVALGAFLSLRGETSALGIGASCWAANTASAAWVYFLARRHGEALLRRRWAERLLPPAARKAVELAYRRHGMLGIFASRFLPGFRATVTPFAGLVGLSPLRALVPAALASAIWYALIVLAGTALGLSWDAVKALLERANRVLLAVALALLALLVWWLRTRERRA